MTSSRTARHADDAFGRRLGEKFGLDDVPYIVTRSLQSAEMAVSELRIDKPLDRLSDPIVRQDAYALSLILRDQPNTSNWEDEREVAMKTIRAGECTVHDLRRSPMVLIDKPLHAVLL